MTLWSLKSTWVPTNSYDPLVSKNELTVTKEKVFVNIIFGHIQSQYRVSGKTTDYGRVP